MDKLYIIRPIDAKQSGTLVSCPADQTPKSTWVAPGETIEPLTERETRTYLSYLSDIDRLRSQCQPLFDSCDAEFCTVQSQLLRVYNNARAWCRRKHIRLPLELR